MWRAARLNARSVGRRTQMEILDHEAVASHMRQASGAPRALTREEPEGYEEAANAAVGCVDSFWAWGEQHAGPIAG